MIGTEQKQLLNNGMPFVRHAIEKLSVKTLQIKIDSGVKCDAYPCDEKRTFIFELVGKTPKQKAYSEK